MGALTVGELTTKEGGDLLMVDIFSKEVPKSDHRMHLLTVKSSTINNGGRERKRERDDDATFLWILTTCGCVNKSVTERLKM